MSDIGQAAPAAPISTPAPAPQAAPQQAEVPIQQNVERPTPIDTQFPQKETRRDSIQKAFDKAGKTEVKPETKHRGMGDNHPPEPMEKEKLDLKKPPPKDGDRPRSEHGHFAPRQEEGRQPPSPNGGFPPQSANGQQKAPLAHGTNPLPEHAPYRDPPPRMAPHAQAEWHQAPESVRGEVHRMHKEMSDAYQRFRADHEEMNTIRPFHQMAQEHGTTLQRALNNYTTMERKLVEDPFGGFDMITSNLNLHTPEGQKLTFRDLAYAYLQQSPEQHKLLQQQNAQSSQSYQLGAINQKVDAIANHFQQMQYQQAHQYMRSGVDQFAATHPRFDELGAQIHQEVMLGFDLDTAYQRADRLYPATHAAQTRQTTPSAQTRDKSISGAPSSSPSDGRRGNGKQVSSREAVTAAINAVRAS
jgi:hypothetical protein